MNQILEESEVKNKHLVRVYVNNENMYLIFADETFAHYQSSTDGCYDDTRIDFNDSPLINSRWANQEDLKEIGVSA